MTTSNRIFNNIVVLIDPTSNYYLQHQSIREILKGYYSKVPLTVQ